MFILLLFFILPTPDVPIPTPPAIETIVRAEIPREYPLQSVSSIRRISTFEGENRPMKWLILTLRNKSITNESEIYRIAEPICRGLLSHDTGYEGMDIQPTSLFLRGANCSIWGP